MTVLYIYIYIYIYIYNSATKRIFVRCYAPFPTYIYIYIYINLFNPFMPSGIFYLISLDQSISFRRDVCLVLSITMFYRNSCILMQTV